MLRVSVVACGLFAIWAYFTLQDKENLAKYGMPVPVRADVKDVLARFSSSDPQSFADAAVDFLAQFRLHWRSDPENVLSREVINELVEITLARGAEEMPCSESDVASGTGHVRYWMLSILIYMIQPVYDTGYLQAPYPEYLRNHPHLALPLIKNASTLLRISSLERQCPESPWVEKEHEGFADGVKTLCGLYTPKHTPSWDEVSRNMQSHAYSLGVYDDIIQTVPSWARGYVHVFKIVDELAQARSKAVPTPGAVMPLAVQLQNFWPTSKEAIQINMQPCLFDQLVDVILDPRENGKCDVIKTSMFSHLFFITSRNSEYYPFLVDDLNLVSSLVKRRQAILDVSLRFASSCANNPTGRIPLWDERRHLILMDNLATIANAPKQPRSSKSFMDALFLALMLLIFAGTIGIFFVLFECPDLVGPVVARPAARVLWTCFGLLEYLVAIAAAIVWRIIGPIRARGDAAAAAEADRAMQELLDETAAPDRGGGGGVRRRRGKRPVRARAKPSVAREAPVEPAATAIAAEPEPEPTLGEEPRSFEPEPEPTRDADTPSLELEATPLEADTRSLEPTLDASSPSPEPTRDAAETKVDLRREEKVEEPDLRRGQKVEEPDLRREQKVEEPDLRREQKVEEDEESLVSRVLSLLGQERLLPLFAEHEIDDDALFALEPNDLIGLGVAAGTALEILAATRAAGKQKHVAMNDIFDGVERHQKVLEVELADHRATIERLRISRSELPDDLFRVPRGNGAAVATKETGRGRRGDDAGRRVADAAGRRRAKQLPTAGYVL